MKNSSRGCSKSAGYSFLVFWALVLVSFFSSCDASGSKPGEEAQQCRPEPVFKATALPSLFLEMADHYGGLHCSVEHGNEASTDVCRLWAVHQMLTTTSATDGAVGGAFRLPYFWHWTEPNPRLSIVSRPDQQPLVQLEPPPGYGRYKTFGHIDRKPALYLGDVAADEPRYFHPDVGEFSSFGWCSEREMAFCALAAIWGYEVKVVQHGIHVVSVVRLETAAPSPEVLVDTTFNMFSLGHTEASLSDWQNDIGEGTSAKWYNEVCHDPHELKAVKEISVPARAKERLVAQVESYFGRF